MSFLDIVSKFNQQADSHSRSQSLNPFSEQFDQSRSPSPRFSREEYGKPVAGSKTDLRGRKAKSHICREILELCTVIHDVGTYNSKKKDPDDDDDEEDNDDGTIIVSFGELFQIYTKISDKVVGLLIAAKRRGFVYFDREILFQRRDDDVLIALLKPISEISKLLKEDISQASGSAPVEPKPAENTKTTSPGKTKRAKAANKVDKRNDGPQTNGVSDVNGYAAVDAEIDGRRQKTNCTNGEDIVQDGVDDERVINDVIDVSENKEDDDDDDSVRVDSSVEGVVRGVDDEFDDIKTEENDGINEAIKTDDVRDGIETDGTRDVDEANTERTDDSTNGRPIGNKSENDDLASGDVTEERAETDENGMYVEVHEDQLVQCIRVDGINDNERAVMDDETERVS